MIRTDREAEAAKMQLSKLQELYDTQLADLKRKGLSEEQAKESLSSSWTYASQCQEEIKLYENLRNGILPPAEHFSSRGNFFVAARIAKGMSQRELADKMGSKESAVSRDERNEYHGMSVDKMDKLATALNIKVLLESK